MVSRLVLLLGLFTAMCGAPDPGPDGRIRARIAEDTVLTLPATPTYPETRTFSQVVRARYGDRDAAFESVLSLSPEQATIVITILGGPRLATVHWDESGIREERTLLAPGGVPVENILADIFLVQWPADVVAEALPEGVELVVGAEGERVIRRGETVIVEISRDPADARRTVVRNLAFGYEVTLISQDVE